MSGPPRGRRLAGRTRVCLARRSSCPGLLRTGTDWTAARQVNNIVGPLGHGRPARVRGRGTRLRRVRRHTRTGSSSTMFGLLRRKGRKVQFKNTARKQSLIHNVTLYLMYALPLLLFRCISLAGTLTAADFQTAGATRPHVSAPAVTKEFNAVCRSCHIVPHFHVEQFCVTVAYIRRHVTRLHRVHHLRWC